MLTVGLPAHEVPITELIRVYDFQDGVDVISAGGQTGQVDDAALEAPAESVFLG